MSRTEARRAESLSDASSPRDFSNVYPSTDAAAVPSRRYGAPLSARSGVHDSVAGATFDDAHRPAMVGLDHRPMRAIAESAVITVGIPAIGYFIDRQDPFFLRAEFFWLIFAPLLICLRHGFTLGFASAALLDATVVVAWRTQFVPLAKLPGASLVALLALAMIAGQFSDLWRRELARRGSALGLLRRQANELARSHFLLEVSHDRLDDQMEHSRSTLRDALAALKALAADSSPMSFTDHGAAMMDLFAVHCGLEAGELLRVERGTIGERCAILGQPQETAESDPMLLHAVKTRRLTYVPAATRPNRDRALARSPLLAAIPFASATGEVTAVLCIHAMPFISFERRNLDVMATLGGHFADLVRGNVQTAEAPPRSLEAAVESTS